MAARTVSQTHSRCILCLFNQFKLTANRGADRELLTKICDCFVSEISGGPTVDLYRRESEQIN